MKALKKFMALGLSAMLMTSVIAGCSSGQKATTNSGDTVKIGVFQPLTGANSAGGQLELRGAEIAHELRPEVLGKKVELVVADNKSDKAEATSAVARLIEKDKVSAIIGSWGSSLSMAAGDLVKTNKVPAITGSATNPQVTLGNDYYFRVAFLDSFQAKVIANYAYKTLNAKKVAIIQEVSSDYSTGLAKFFTEEFVKLSGDPNAIVSVSNYNTGDQDFRGILTTVKDSNPDAVFAAGNYTESALLIKQAHELGLNAPFLGCDTWETNEFITVGGKDVEGAVLSTFFDDTNPDLSKHGKDFVEAYRKKYPGEEIPAFAALNFDAYNIVLDAIEKAGTADPQAIRDAMQNTKDYPGATGAINFDQNGDAKKNTAVLKTVKDGKFTFFENVTID